MKKLHRIILVNWYLFEADEWEIDGHVALVGKNGSGKSSFIDALQYVQLGGNKSDWQPNAKATDRRRMRDVRSYILGLIKDEEALEGATAYQPRPDALCRIVLVYVDEATGEATSVGAALSARRSEPQETVEGFFIAENCGLALADLLESTPSGNVPRPYGALRQHISHKAENVHYFKHEPKAFVAQLLASLGPAKRSIATEKYRRAFKQSINMSGLEGSVSEFVRSSILDDKPINLEQMRQSIASWRNKQAAVARIKDQISKLEQILTHLRRAQSAGQRRSGHLACVAEFRFMAADFRRDELTTVMDNDIARYRQLRLEKRAVTQETIRIEAELREVNITLDNDHAESALMRLRERLEVLQRDEAQLASRLVDARQRLGYVADLAGLAEHLAPVVAKQLTELSRVSQDVCGVWPEDSKAVDAAVAGMKELLPGVLEDVDARREAAALRIDEAQKAEAKTQQDLDSLREGKSPLHSNTQLLIRVLKEHGIDAVPICDLVEVTDRDWQPAIEAFLASNTQALIVDPDQAERAVEIYRRAKHAVYGSTVVNTLKVMQWDDPVEPGTAPALIRGENPLAVAYLRRLLRNIRLRDVGTAEFMREQRALSKDGMFVADAALQRKQPRPLMLGKGAREDRIKTLEHDLAEQQTARLAAEDERNSFRALHSIASALSHNLNEFPNMTALITQQVEKSREIQSMQTQMEAIDTRHLDDLRVQKARLSDAHEGTKKQLEKLTETLGGVKNNFKVHRKLRDEVVVQIPYLSEQRQMAREDVDYDSQRANELLEVLESALEVESVAGYEQQARKAEGHAKADAKRQDTERQTARDLLVEYRAAYSSEGVLMEPLTAAGERAELELMLDDLRNIGLHEREKEVADAVAEFQRFVRSDLALRLRNNIRDMQIRFNELNAELKQRPFSSNQIYQFHYSKLNEFSEFLSFVENVDEYLAADTGGLFDQYAHINNQIEELMSGESGDKLADYREYYTFDIEIRDSESGIREMLSRRLGAASGGEHKTPFYVAMGASLASAYRLERQPEGGIDGGLSLYLADEAFEKMDALNTLQAANYLKSIGLQLFIAAPDDAEPRLRQLVDTVLFFIRTGDKAYVDIDYVTDAARELLTSTYNPKALAHV